jgi:hypothetical protein
MRGAGICVVITFLSACGEDGGSTPADAVPDDAAPDAAPAAVTVTAKLRGAPAANLPVVWHDSTGSLLGQTSTDASGNATLAMPDGGLVTVVDSRETGEVMPMTVGGVEPGDALTFTLAEVTLEGTPVTTATLAVPSMPGLIGYQFHSGCEGMSTGSGSPNVLARIKTHCLDAAENFHVLGLAYGSDGLPRAWTLLADQPKTTTAATFPAWSESLETATLALGGLPTTTESTSLEMALRIGGIPRYWHNSSVDGASGTATMHVPPGTGNARFWQGVALLPAAGGFRPVLGVFAVTDTTQTTTAFDFGAAPLPRVDSVALDFTAAPKVSWGVTGASGGTDSVVLYVSARQNDREIDWYISLPPGTQSPFTLPALPGDLASLVPAATGDPDVFLMLVDVEGLDAAQVRSDATRWGRWAVDGPADDAAPFRMRTSSASRDQ